MSCANNNKVNNTRTVVVSNSASGYAGGFEKSSCGEGWVNKPTWTGPKTGK